MANRNVAHFGITRYSDLTSEEFAAAHLNKNMSHIVEARLKTIQDQQPKNVSTTLKVDNVKYEFTNNNEYNRYPMFYKQELLQKNLNFIPMEVDWYVDTNPLNSFNKN